MKTRKVMKVWQTVLVSACVLTLTGCFDFNTRERISRDDNDYPEATDVVVEEITDETTNGQQTTDEQATANRPHVTIKAGTDGGQWEVLESGETVYFYPANNTSASNAWIEDPDGTIFYVDASGCVMHDNRAPDGFSTDNRGAWNASIPQVRDQTDPLTLSNTYNDTRTQMEAHQWTLHLTEQGEGTAVHRYSFGTTEQFTCQSSGIGTFTLTRRDDPDNKYHVAVYDEGKTLRFSCAGETCVMYAER